MKLGWGKLGYPAAAFLLLVACDDSRELAREPVSSPASKPNPIRVATPHHRASSYPDGSVLVATVSECRIAKLGPSQKKRWTRKLDGCGGILETTVAANSYAYVRTAERLDAIGPAGDTLWQKRVGRVDASLASISTCLDSTVVTAASSSTVLALQPDGEQAWTFKIGGEERIAAGPVGSRSEGALVVTNAAAYAIGGDGQVRWRTPFEVVAK